MEKFKTMMGGNVTALSDVNKERTPMLTSVGGTFKLVCQYTGLLADKLYCCRVGKHFSGYVVDPQIAREILIARDHVKETPVVEIAHVEKVLLSQRLKNTSAAKKKEVCYFRVQGTNIEKFHGKQEVLKQLETEFQGTPDITYSYMVFNETHFFFNASKVKMDTLVAALAFDVKCISAKAPKLPDGILMCTPKVAEKTPRLKMLLNEMKGKMPISKTKFTKLKEKVDVENQQEKFQRKHNNKKLKNVDRIPFQTPKRLRDIANGPDTIQTPNKKTKKSPPKGHGSVMNIKKIRGHLKHADTLPTGADSQPFVAENTGESQGLQLPVPGCDSL